MSYDWSAFDLYFYIGARVQDVFSRWVTPQGQSSFFVSSASFDPPRDAEERCQKGDRYQWVWPHGHRSTGEILAVRADEFLSFSFGETTVDLIFEATPGGTRIHLRQHQIPTTEDGQVNIHLNCRGGWIFFLTNLRVVMGGLADARVSNPEWMAATAPSYQPPD